MTRAQHEREIRQAAQLLALATRVLVRAGMAAVKDDVPVDIVGGWINEEKRAVTDG